MAFDKIEIAPFDNLLVYKKGYTNEMVYNIITSKKLGGLRIFSVLKGDRLESLDFLRDYTFLERLDVTSVADYDFSFLRELTELKKLSINTQGENVINLINQRSLEHLSVKWRKNIVGLGHCTQLLSLGLIEFTEENFKKISPIKGLQEIRIKTGAIQNLAGIEEIANLQTLSLSNCKKLKCIIAVNHLIKLKELYLDMCPNIKDYVDVADLPSLETLSLINCGNVQTLKFIQQFKSLLKLSLLGNTIVGDGDLIPAKMIKHLEHKHYDHYNLKLENSVYNDNIKKNLVKIKNLFK
ncbi:MAG: hypothetical protein ABWZ25_15260 [Chitinophagaceae bacterium]